MLDTVIIDQKHIYENKIHNIWRRAYAPDYGKDINFLKKYTIILITRCNRDRVTDRTKKVMWTITIQPVLNTIGKNLNIIHTSSLRVTNSYYSKQSTNEWQNK